jgi:hypothetical protein
MPPASTGTDKSNKKDVTNKDQQNNGILRIVIPGARIFNIVAIKFVDPMTDESPAKCRLKIATSTAAPGCPNNPESGGYTVHPVPTPPSITLESINNEKDGGNNQKLRLFILGNAISKVPSCIGIIQFPNPPIKIGITIKKIMTNA